MNIGKKCMSIKKKSKKAPKVGDKIEHTCRLNGKFQGKVIEMLAMQFVYETLDKNRRFCLFREDWDYVDELSPIKRKPVQKTKKKRR